MLDAEVAWRRQRLSAGARPRRNGRGHGGVSLRQRLGLAVVQVGLTVAGGLIVGPIETPFEVRPR
jgi:hypothetical protein